jgi:hypothetical protein
MSSQVYNATKWVKILFGKMRKLIFQNSVHGFKIKVICDFLGVKIASKECKYIFNKS